MTKAKAHAARTRRLIAGNWKMHGLRAALDEITKIDRVAHDFPLAEVVIFPPFPLMAMAASQVSSVAIGGQDIHPERHGAFTGGVSAEMIVDAGARWVIVGHSECRRVEGYEPTIPARIGLAQQAGLSVILCVGEPEGLDARAGATFVAGQLCEALSRDLDLDRLAIAYEPIWAVGTGHVATPAHIDQSMRALAADLGALFGANVARIRLLYGGSVNPGNAAAILALDMVSGVLVGCASLYADSFAPIIAASGTRSATS